MTGCVRCHHTHVWHALQKPAAPQQTPGQIQPGIYSNPSSIDGTCTPTAYAQAAISPSPTVPTGTPQNIPLRAPLTAGGSPTSPQTILSNSGLPNQPTINADYPASSAPSSMIQDASGCFPEVTTALPQLSHISSSMSTAMSGAGSHPVMSQHMLSGDVSQYAGIAVGLESAGSSRRPAVSNVSDLLEFSSKNTLASSAAAAHALRWRNNSQRGRSSKEGGREGDKEEGKELPFKSVAVALGRRMSLARGSKRAPGEESGTVPLETHSKTDPTSCTFQPFSGTTADPASLQDVAGMTAWRAPAAAASTQPPPAASMGAATDGVPAAVAAAAAGYAAGGGAAGYAAATTAAAGVSDPASVGGHTSAFAADPANDQEGGEALGECVMSNMSQVGVSLSQAGPVPREQRVSTGAPVLRPISGETAGKAPGDSAKTSVETSSWVRLFTFVLLIISRICAEFLWLGLRLLILCLNSLSAVAGPISVWFRHDRPCLLNGLWNCKRAENSKLPHCHVCTLHLRHPPLHLQSPHRRLHPHRPSLCISR